MQPYHEKISLPDVNIPIKSFLVNSLTNDINSNPHWHDMIELLYFEEGTATQQVGSNIFKAVKGDLVILTSNAIHSTFSLNDRSIQILVLQFDLSLLNIPQLFNQTDIPVPLHSEYGIGSFVRDCMYQIHDEYCTKGISYELIVRAKIFELSGLILRNFKDIDKTSHNHSSDKKIHDMLRNTFTLIDNNYQGIMTLKDAANASSYSIPHFLRLFRKATGMSFTEYLSFYRVKKSLYLLQKDISILDIAMECGFGNYSSYIRSFKKFMFLTPTQYKTDELYNRT